MEHDITNVAIDVLAKPDAAIASFKFKPFILNV